jgi:hypothetical protein
MVFGWQACTTAAAGDIVRSCAFRHKRAIEPLTPNRFALLTRHVRHDRLNVFSELSVSVKTTN